MNISSEIKFAIPGVVVKATGLFMVAGKMIMPGKLAVLSEQEARHLFARELAIPADPADLGAGGTIEISGTIDADTLSTLLTEAPEAVQLAAAKTIGELLRAGVEGAGKRTPKAAKAALRRRTKAASIDAPLMPQIQG
ncbi:hypothetical protein [Luteimonas mephitis]|uniref:hypothetical protein n=1 Tax=Luteimonas mephitis TaxID=83615 RepID=UPI003A925BAD